MKLRSPADIDVYWHNTIASIPHKFPSLIIGHEFLDALPIQKFQYTNKGWREILIDLKEHLDWETDADNLDILPGTDHSTVPILQQPPASVDPNADNNLVQFKEILCPHNNMAAAAMLGGLFQGEQVEQEVAGNESGRSGNRALV